MSWWKTALYDTCSLIRTPTVIAFLESNGVEFSDFPRSRCAVASDPTGGSGKWSKSISVLENLRIQTDSSEAPSDASSPNCDAISEAIRFLRRIQESNSFDPPSIVWVDPEGGIAIEFGRTKDFPKGYLIEWIFFNDGRIEYTRCVDGKVQELRMFPPSSDDINENSICSHRYQNMSLRTDCVTSYVHSRQKSK